jgi:hypothetical protein
LRRIKTFFAVDQAGSRLWVVKVALSLFFSLALVTSIDCLFLGFLIQSWVKRVVILVISGPLIVLVMYWVIFKLLALGQDFSRKVWGVFWLVGIVTGALLWPVYRDRLPPIPARHVLEINILCDQASTYTGKEVQILWISRLVLPSKVESPITSSEVEQSGSWQVGNGGWYTNCEQPSSLRFSEFIQGGVTIGFIDMPSIDLVRVTWDGKPQKLIFFSPKEQVQAARLITNTPGENLTSTWKILIAILWISEFISISGLAFLISFIFYSTASRPRHVKAFALDSLHTVYQLRRLAEPIVSRRTLLALALPVMLLVGIVINLLVIGQNIRFGRLSSNDLLAFARESVGKDGNSIVYFYILNHYMGRTLVVDPTLLDQTRLLPEELVGLSRIGQVENRSYRVMLAPAEARSLQNLPNYQIAAQSNLRMSYRFFDSPDKTEPLCLQRFGDEIFLGPISLLLGCKEAQ